MILIIVLNDRRQIINLLNVRMSGITCKFVVNLNIASLYIVI
ncbi:Uncharacterized protein GY17_00000495 [Cryptosporidium hominis]|uniref:Uncharacterized protein n=1 Tax=Cryptosporidium hominis TaxID=237895 RepID=A0ABX5BIB5_CRYHO|nr:Uncharacterized protein GY17_00000495 [Cryptosporidium hominis]|eukprot:PPS97813.1 Uncharacterized protein GY17_00000495 [Cryptosporidium hominis]